MRVRKIDLHTKFQLGWPKIALVIPFFHFLVGGLVGPVCMNGFW